MLTCHYPFAGCGSLASAAHAKPSAATVTEPSPSPSAAAAIAMQQQHQATSSSCERISLLPAAVARSSVPGSSRTDRPSLRVEASAPQRCSGTQEAVPVAYGEGAMDLDKGGEVNPAEDRQHAARGAEAGPASASPSPSDRRAPTTRRGSGPSLAMVSPLGPSSVGDAVGGSGGGDGGGGGGGGGSGSAGDHVGGTGRPSRGSRPRVHLDLDPPKPGKEGSVPEGESFARGNMRAVVIPARCCMDASRAGVVVVCVCCVNCPSHRASRRP